MTKRAAASTPLVGFTTTGIYGTSACPVHRGRGATRMVFSTHAAARYAGFLPCKVCRPDAEYGDGSAEVARFDTLAMRVRSNPAMFPDVASLAQEANLSEGALGHFVRDHAHLSPSQWLTRLKLAHAEALFTTTAATVGDVADASGFDDPGTFTEAFGDWFRTTPDAYRALDVKKGFALSLPQGYRSVEILAYYGREPVSEVERTDGIRIWKALTLEEGPVVIELEPGDESVKVTIHGTSKSLSLRSISKLHSSARLVLGLTGDIVPFETVHASFVSPRRGLRVPLIPEGFDALCWGIIGQQINLAFAGALRRDMVSLLGTPVAGMRAHPTPSALAQLDLSELTGRRFSRSKARYVIDAAQAVATGALQVEGLTDKSAVAAEAALTAQRGIGTWTARYVLMRCGFADIAPVGDSGIATALQRLHGLDLRPQAPQVARLMSLYSPHRSLASMHLWQTLSDHSVRRSGDF